MLVRPGVGESQQKASASRRMAGTQGAVGHEQRILFVDIVSVAACLIEVGVRVVPGMGVIAIASIVASESTTSARTRSRRLPGQVHKASLHQPGAESPPHPGEVLPWSCRIGVTPSRGHLKDIAPATPPGQGPLRDLQGCDVPD